MIVKKVISISMFLGCCFVSGAQAATAKETLAGVLFSGSQGLPVIVQQDIADQLLKKGFSVDQGRVVSTTCGKVDVKVEVKDLNNDGKQEALMLIGNECTSGKIGATLYLFTQETDKGVQRHFGFSASGYALLTAKNDSWPAVMVKGTGGCLPVWRYKNGRYAFNNLYEESKGACAVPQSGGHGG